MTPKTAVILVNTGTPASPQVKDVRKYLREFLGDSRVINMPWLFRKMLVNGIIAPFRGPKSSKLYRKIWTPEGSPLLINSRKFGNALQASLGDTYNIEVAMRYGQPSIKNAIINVSEKHCAKIILAPLYPQYADSTTGTIVAEFYRLIKKYASSAETVIVEPFFSNPGFIAAFASKIKDANPEKYDHVLFSFHGLPVKQTEKMHPGYTCTQANCMNEYNDLNAKCYYASCYATARMLSTAAGLKENGYTVSFQSRLGMNWLKPYTDEVLKQKAVTGAKKLLIVSPAFVADCLETIHELGDEYKHLFIENGGEVLTLVDSLNDDASWVDAMSGIIRDLA